MNTQPDPSTISTSDGSNRTIQNEPTVGQMLRSLPRQRAPSELGARILRRVRGARIEDQRGFALRLWTELGARRLVTPAVRMVGALVVLMILGIAWASWLEASRRIRADQARAELDLMRQKYRALENELADLRRLAAEFQPVVGLAGSDRVDYLVDLRELVPEMRDSHRVTGARAVPAHLVRTQQH